jgi:hypothetical protein
MAPSVGADLGRHDQALSFNLCVKATYMMAFVMKILDSVDVVLAIDALI